MKTIAFIDTEIAPKTKRVEDIGAIRYDGAKFHKNSGAELTEFLKEVEYICGHFITQHDVKYIGNWIEKAGISSENIIDTLYWSPLLFPSKPYHKLLKDDKLQTEELNNPLNDAIKAQDLFYDEVATFSELDDDVKQLLYLLLRHDHRFSGFFKYLNYQTEGDPTMLIPQIFGNHICHNADIDQFIQRTPVELAYCLSLISASEPASITPGWVLAHFREVERLMFLLRQKPCITGCPYCDHALDAHRALERYFGYNSFREYGGRPLQLDAVNAAINSKSFIAVFPTGGGKSITFQVPALLAGENARALTVVISPLQSLMKDQVDNLEKSGITTAVTINGLLDPIERSKAIERVADGSACMLYISPESLRSPTIYRLLLCRKIARFVIDEAHCFSSWGQDFRVDYLYIGEMIKQIREYKQLAYPIPISCFTATAKPQVIDDICKYFEDKLGLSLNRFTSSASRTNLHYKVLAKGNDEEKYQATRELIEEQDRPAIVYVSRTRRAEKLAERLKSDGLNAKAFHGKLDAAEKVANQDAFLSGRVDIIVATSAFGMGVDKKDVGIVIHHDISDSLENYVQEAGRAGRDENIEADCYVLFNEDDLSKHFIMLNQTKISIKEIQQIWRTIKYLTRFRDKMSNSALEVARQAGWDDSVDDIETRVTTAIAALEDAGYLKRGQNQPRVFASSILSKNSQEAIDKIMLSESFSEKQKEMAVRIIKKLFSSKSKRLSSDETAESRVDYISDHLGIVRGDVIRIINLLRQEQILADEFDLAAFIKRGDAKTSSLRVVNSFGAIERCLLNFIDEHDRVFNLKELNESLEAAGCSDVSPNKIKTIINFWAIKNWINRTNSNQSKDYFKAKAKQPADLTKERFENRHTLSIFIIELLYKKVSTIKTEEPQKEEILVEFSIIELLQKYQQGLQLFDKTVTIDDIEDALFYLSRIKALKIEGGFMVVYNRLTVKRLEQNTRVQYKEDDYQKLDLFYQNRTQQIHIVGEYAQKMIDDYVGALQFVEDYFWLNYPSFLNKYFKGGRQKEISLNLTPAKYKELIGELSPMQSAIISDNTSKYIVIAAGPGSGKTKVLVHKLASLMMLEDVKHEQLLMLTFSRAAATEFKKRLLKLVGNAANFIEIKTFHSYCFDLLGKVGSIDGADTIIKRTIEKIKSKEVEPNRITKTVLVIDEAQDMDEDNFNLVSTLMAENEEMRVIAVGDDDQNIYQFRGSNSEHLKNLAALKGGKLYELTENYRSKNNIVEFAHQFTNCLQGRLKNTPVSACQTDDGVLKINRYTHGDLIIPTVTGIVHTPLVGSTCVLTHTNSEAEEITGLLLKHGLKAKLIRSNDGFALYNLAEIKYFLDHLNTPVDIHVITDKAWDEAKRSVKTNFSKSENWQILEQLIGDFETVNPKKKYRSDLDVFIRESKLENFYQRDTETIFVSTIHKSKGREFDNLFLMLDGLENTLTEQQKRQLYVAVTRAKQNLTIHLNSSHFDHIKTTNMHRTEITGQNPPTDQLSLHLTHTDVYLDHFYRMQPQVAKLLAGDNLEYLDEEYLESSGYPVIKFSRQFMEKIASLKVKNFKLKEAVVNFVVWWQKEGTQQQVMIVLPKLTFEKDY
ncbi:MAG: RecQ family ATP-dependent DNA helicase [Bacteroidota bacterium]